MTIHRATPWVACSATTNDPTCIDRPFRVAKPFRIQVVSDLHFDSNPWCVPWLAEGAEAVVVAGDTCEGVEKAFAYLRAAFPRPMPILTVLGNTAFHGRVLIEERQRAKELAPRYGITLLENNAAFLGGVRFVGGTMWTDYALDGSETQRDTMRAAMDRMADHRRTTLCTVPCQHSFTPRHALALFRISTAYIAGALTEDWGMPTVVVTHHAPSARSLSPKLKADHLAGAFASRLDSMVRGSGAAVWIHGHVHASRDYRLGRTRVVCNPRGRDQQNPAFDPTLVIEVPR